MTEGDFDRIERALGVRLPEVYRRQLSPYPLASEAGNADSPVWDDAEKLIRLNERLRAETEGWPAWLFVVGQSEGDPCGYAVDLRSPDSPVWWLEQMRVGPASGPIGERFAEWFSQYVEEASSDEGGDGGLLKAFLLWLALSVLAVVAYWIRTVRRVRGMRR